MKRFRKWLLVWLAGTVLLATSFWAYKRLTTPEISVQAIQATLDGTTTGVKFFEASGWYVGDGNWNRFLTWVNLSGYITGFTETDPIRIAASGNYYTSGEVELKISWLLTYKYDWSFASWTFPQPINTGDYYIISTAGTGGGYYYGTGDMIISNKKKTSWVTSWDFDVVINTMRPEADPIAMQIIRAQSGDWNYFITHSWNYLTGWALARTQSWDLLTPVYTWDVRFQVGNWASARNNDCIAIWFSSICSWDSSTAIGRNATAYGLNSFGMGYGSIANGEQSFSMWASANASGAYSNAIWVSAVTLWRRSTAIWLYTKTLDDYTIAIGKYNVWITGSILEVGYGTGTSNRNNALVVYNSWETRLSAYDMNGNAYITWNALSWYLTGSALSGYITGTISTGITYPGWTKLTRESDVVSYLENYLTGLGDVMTTGWYYRSDTGTLTNTSRRTLVTGNSLSFSTYTGLAWSSKLQLWRTSATFNYPLTVSWNITASNGMLRQSNTRHSFWGFQLQVTTIDITATSWRKMITNASWNLWTGLEANGMTLSWDIMTITNTGDYFWQLTISVAGQNNDDVCIRLYNITKAKQIWYFICWTTLGTSNYIPLPIPLYIDDDANDQFRMEIANITNTNDVNVRSAAFYITYLHD